MDKWDEKTIRWINSVTENEITIATSDVTCRACEKFIE